MDWRDFRTAFAFIIWFQLIFRAGASNTSMVTFLIPITALFLSIIILDEKIEVASWVGLGIILFGLAVAQNRVFKIAWSKKYASH